MNISMDTVKNCVSLQVNACGISDKEKARNIYNRITEIAVDIISDKHDIPDSAWEAVRNNFETIYDSPAAKEIRRLIK